VNSKTSDEFWKHYANLPVEIKKQARQAFHRFVNNPYHPGLHFKRIHSTRPIFSVRISRNYRAVGITHDNEIVWFWIGSHNEYDKLIKTMRNA